MQANKRAVGVSQDPAVWIQRARDVYTLCYNGVDTGTDVDQIVHACDKTTSLVASTPCDRNVIWS